MPIYAYRCESCGHAQDVLQKISDPVLTQCPACGAASFKKQVTAAGFQLKGTGWYVTDFRGGNSGGNNAGSTGGAAAEAGAAKDGAGAAPAPSAAPDAGSSSSSSSTSTSASGGGTSSSSSSSGSGSNSPAGTP